MITFEFLGFLVGAGLAIAVWINGQLGDQLWLAGILICLGVLIGTVIPRFVFRSLISAQCGEENCPGPAFPVGSNPIVYVCRHCGRKVATRISEGDDPSSWHDRT